MRGQVDRPLVFRKDSLPGIWRQFRKSPRVGEGGFVAKTELGGDLRSPAELFGPPFGFHAEADGGEPGPAGIEGKSVREQISQGLGGSYEFAVALRNPGGVAQLVNELRVGGVRVVGLVVSKGRLQDALVVRSVANGIPDEAGKLQGRSFE